MKSATKHVRRPAAAGVFYAGDAIALRHEIRRYLRRADSAGPCPKALIVPHARYQYSGPVAASGYCLLKPMRHLIKHVVLLGPSHHVPFHGLAVSSDDEFSTPLGTIPVDTRLVAAALRLSQVHILDEAHRHEHSLEVQLPFLQTTLDEFSLVPLVIGHATVSEVSDVLEVLWGDSETLVVVSSDLSHFHDYSTARGMDSETSHLIERCQWQQLTDERACGCAGIRGLLRVAKHHGLKVETIDLGNSGDTTGSREQVVGYGSFVAY